VAEAWANRFRGLLADITGRAAPSHGYPARAVESAEARLGARLPGPLRDYYLSVGPTGTAPGSYPTQWIAAP
jgi:hypothetical protein